MIARWQSDRLLAGGGPVAVHDAATLLGGILQRAFENGHLQSNPTRAVRKPPLPRRKEVRPLAPIVVERMRATASPRDAVLLSVLAYAGLRPGEALALHWLDIREQTILIERALSLGQENDTKTDAHRTVQLLAPLAADLREWRLRSGRPAQRSLIFPSRTGEPWSLGAYQSWRRRAFQRALSLALIDGSNDPLSRSCPACKARAGKPCKNARLTLSTYGHVIDEFDDLPHLSAETAISDARTELAAGKRLDKESRLA